MSWPSGRVSPVAEPLGAGAAQSTAAQATSAEATASPTSADQAVGDAVEKTMSITRREFEMGLARLADWSAQADGPTSYRLNAVERNRSLMVSFEPQPDRVLSPLMKLPVARVTLRLETMPLEERAEFVALFDRTFQRGGG